MFETNNTRKHEVMAITSMQALGLSKPDRRVSQNAEETQGSAGQGLSLKDAEKQLKSLVAEGWLEKSRKGYYSLTPRALMELRGWLMETYNVDDDEEPVIKVRQCNACKEIITSVRDVSSCESCMLTGIGSTMPQSRLWRSPARHLHSTILYYAEI